MEKTIIIVLILSGIILTVITSCDPFFWEDGCHSYIKITNNSNTDICTDATFSYPDTTIYDFNPLRNGRKTAIGTTGKGSAIGAVNVCLEERIVHWSCEYFLIFIFDARFMEENLKNENFMINETMALQRYDLTIEDLNSLNWIIPYPPDERMKNMKMYPPYGE